jgi:hypothetical protein
LLLAYVAGRQRIEPANIDEAWGDLQQLPTPWTGEAKREQTGGVIEFGSLDEAEATPTAAAATISMPALRISPMEDEAREEETEPGEQICRIEQLLAEADDEFQPAGSIGPEVELCFEESGHPFEEEFEHEEIVADRYAAATPAAASAAVGPSARATSAPSPLPEAAPPQQETVIQANTERSPSPSSEQVAAIEQEPAATCPAISPLILPTERQWEFVSALAPASGPDWFVADQEQAQEFPPVAPPSPSAPERPPQEFRRLFARLRRG